MTGQIDILDLIVKALIAAIGIGSALLTYLAKQSFEQVRTSLDILTLAVNASKTDVAVLVSRSSDMERRLAALEQRMQGMESESRQIREG
jgi:hypothetical protein